MTTVALFLALSLAAAPPPAADASRLASSKSWDELYLKFSAAKPGDYTEPDRKAIARALLDGANALAGDVALAVSLAEKSVAFDGTAAGWLLVGQLDLRLDQKEAAAGAFEKAITLEPTNVAALLARADLALAEGDWLLAQQLYERVPAGHPERTRAEAGLAKARAAQQEKAKRLAAIQQTERDLATAANRSKDAAKPAAAGTPSHRDVCRALAMGLCAYLKRCAPDDAMMQATTCSAFADDCPQDEEPAPVTNEQVDTCVAGMKKLKCRKMQPGATTQADDLIPECKPLQESFAR